MLYKELEGGEWLVAEHDVIMPNGTIINEENQIDGWFFSKTEPKEYTMWLEESTNILEKN